MLLRKEYNLQLKELHEMLHTMGSLCCEVITLASQRLLHKEEGLHERIRELDGQIDQAQSDVQNLCLKLLLLQNPIAGDLRRVSAALKMVSDMERIGDQAADIADLAQYLSKSGIDGQVRIQEMAEETVKMVEESVAAFVLDDLVLAGHVVDTDDRVDELFLKVRDELVELIRREHVDAKAALDLLMAAKYYERIGDHAVNIAEWVEYSITGQLENHEHRAFAK